MLIRRKLRKLGKTCDDIKVQSLCHKCAELQTYIFYGFKMALNFPEMTLLGIYALLCCSLWNKVLFSLGTGVS